MTRTLWIVSGGAEAVPGIRRAKEMGLHVVVSDGDPEAPGLAWADDPVVASTYDVQATLSAAKEYHHKRRPIDGVLTIAADVPGTVASLAAELGLPGIPVETADLGSDKLAMKRRLAAAGIPLPWFAPIPSPEQLKSVIGERGLPLVIKPVDSRGARGVLKLTRGVSLDWAFRHARRCSPSSRVMVEEYLEGPQISTESVLLDGLASTPGFSDRNYKDLDPSVPFLVENGGHQPSALNDEERLAVAGLAERAALALGIRTGTAKGDMVLTAKGPMVIEIAPRLSGGWFATDQIPLATGVDLVGIAIRLALGESVSPPELRPQFRQAVAIRYFFPPPGRVTAVGNVARFTGLDWIHRIGLFVKPGGIVEPLTDHTRRAGFVIATGATTREAIRRAVGVTRQITIKTVPR
ncbi:MAG: ATP-grasp domain-containing protein [Acidobacteriota bacterium]